MSHSHLTVGEVAGIYDVPSWKIRRIVDSLDIEIPRAGLYRLIPRTLLGRIAVELEQRRRIVPAERQPQERDAGQRGEAKGR